MKVAEVVLLKVVLVTIESKVAESVLVNVVLVIER